MTRRALPARWQLDLVSYDDSDAYPVLILQIGQSAVHNRVVRLLARAGLAAPSGWEWRCGLWPLVTGCRLTLPPPPLLATMHLPGHCLTVGTVSAHVPDDWTRAAGHRRQVLFTLVPPHWPADDPFDPTELGAGAACLAGLVPIHAGVEDLDRN